MQIRYDIKRKVINFSPTVPYSIELFLNKSFYIFFMYSNSWNADILKTQVRDDNMPLAKKNCLWSQIPGSEQELFLITFSSQTTWRCLYIIMFPLYFERNTKYE